MRRFAARFQTLALASAVALLFGGMSGCSDGAACDNVVLDAGASGSLDILFSDAFGEDDTKAGPQDSLDDTYVTPPDIPRPDAGPPPDVAGPDVPGPDVPTFSRAWVNPSCFGDRPLGASCSDHCECETGYCYDEVYLAPFRFCTRFCGGLAEGCGVTNACLNADMPHFTRTYHITLTWFCMPRCGSVDSCRAIDPAYDSCPSPRMTLWDGFTIGPPTCQLGEN